MTPKIPTQGFPPVFVFILALLTIGVAASFMGVRESTSIITCALGGIALAVRARQ